MKKPSSPFALNSVEQPASSSHGVPTSSPSADPPPANAAGPAPEDIPNALRFTHLLEAQTKARVSELGANLNALVETLVAEGTLPLEAYEKRRRLTVVRENQRAAGEANIQVSDVADKYALTDLPNIDCESRLTLCKARCCKLSFPLSVQDLDERVVRWNYGEPYKIAQRPDGYCVHNDGCHCTVYEHRPAVCRTYDCRSDRRIWKDFEARIPADE